MKGHRPRKPAAIRKLHGSRERPHHREEPPLAVPTEVPAAPAGLEDAERVYWDRFASVLVGARVYTAADEQTLAHYCRACAAIDEHSRLRRAAIVAEDNYAIKLHDAARRGYIAEARGLSSVLGLNAVSRTKIAWDKGEDGQPESSLDKLRRQAADMRRPVAVK